MIEVIQKYPPHVTIVMALTIAWFAYLAGVGIFAVIPNWSNEYAKPRCYTVDTTTHTTPCETSGLVPW